MQTKFMVAALVYYTTSTLFPPMGAIVQETVWEDEPADAAACSDGVKEDEKVTEA
jgi:hypothetical protein